MLVVLLQLGASRDSWIVALATAVVRPLGRITKELCLQVMSYIATVSKIHHLPVKISSGGTVSFRDKKRIKFVTLVSGVTMPFEDRLAYSVLLAHKQGLTAARLAKLSGLDRTRTLPKVLVRLGDQALIAKEGNCYVGLPSEIVILHADRNGAETWYDKTCYMKFYLPSQECPLTKKQLAVYYLKLQAKGSTSLIAKLLNVTRQTVISAVKALKQHRLLDVLGDPVPLPEEKFQWWKDKESVRAESEGNLEHLSEYFAPLIEHFQHHAADWIALHPWKAELDKFGKHCKGCGYSFRKVVELLVKTVKRLGNEPSLVARVFRELPKLVQKAEDQTQTNRRLNGYKGRSSFGMLGCKLNDLVQTEKVRRKAE